MKRKIAVVTTTRADYGILKPLLAQIQNDDDLTLQLLASGTHLMQTQGYTITEIEKDFRVTKKIAMQEQLSSKQEIIQAMSQLQNDFAAAFEALRPDIVVLLGDRYEILSIATAAFMMHIPIAHIHGGELTQGAIDDSLRHAITKLSHLHFTATQEYANRVIQLGEEPKRVFNVGSLAVESIKKLQLLSKEELEESIDFKLGKKNLLVTYHPETLSTNTPKEQFEIVLKALDTLKDTKIIFTKSNIDEGGEVINNMIDEYVKHHSNTTAFASLGQLRYFSALQFVDGVVGNSSSGILEVPSFQIPTLNIGNRQQGRIRAKSVIDVALSTETIKQGLAQIFDADFVKSLQDTHSPYEVTNTADIIAKRLKDMPLESLLLKKFYDIKAG